MAFAVSPDTHYKDPVEKMHSCCWKVKMDTQVTQGRPRRRMWIDDIKMWTNLDTYEVIKRTAQDRQTWRTCTTSCRPSATEDDRR